MKRKQWMAVLILGILGSVSVLAAERVLLRGGAPVHVRLKADLDSTRAVMGDRVDLELRQPLVMQGLVVAPEGAVAWGAVQVVNRGKSVRFDVQGVRLPSLAVVKLRSIPEKTSNPAKDVIKVDQGLVPRGSEFLAYVDDDVSVEVAAPAAAPTPTVRPPTTTTAAATTTPVAPPAEPPKPAVASAPVPAPATPVVTAPPAAPVEAKPTEPAPPPVAVAPAKPAESTPPAAQPEAPKPTPPPAPPPPPAKELTVEAPAAIPAAPAPAPAPTPSGMEGVTDWVTVECFSVPPGADILIDGDFYGNTPSILKLPVGKHRLRFVLAGYTPSSRELELPAGAAIRTIRDELQQREQ